MKMYERGITILPREHLIMLKGLKKLIKGQCTAAVHSDGVGVKDIFLSKLGYIINFIIRVFPIQLTFRRLENLSIKGVIHTFIYFLNFFLLMENFVSAKKTVSNSVSEFRLGSFDKSRTARDRGKSRPIFTHFSNQPREKNQVFISEIFNDNILSIFFRNE